LTPRKHVTPGTIFRILADNRLRIGSYCQKFRMRGKSMEEETDAMRGILLGVLTGATVWFMVYVAIFH
jgi:hypothetical protein